MSFTVTKVDIWSCKIEDKPGGLANVLTALGNASASLDCVIARRDPAKGGTGDVFITPIKGPAARKAAQSSSLSPAKNLGTLKVEETRRAWEVEWRPPLPRPELIFAAFPLRSLEESSWPTSVSIALQTRQKLRKF